MNPQQIYNVELPSPSVSMSEDQPGSTQLFQLQSPVALYSLIAYTGLCLTTNLLGNLTILVCSFQHRAYRQDYLSVMLMRHMALSDLLYGINTLQPTLGSLIAGKWPYSRTYCWLTGYLKSYIFFLSLLLLCGLNITKLQNVRKPLRILSRSRVCVQRSCYLFWLFPLAIPLVEFVMDHDAVVFHYLPYRCVHVAANWKYPVLRIIIQTR